MSRSEIYAEVDEERERQLSKFGPQHWPFDRPGAWWNDAKEGTRGAARRCEEHGLECGASVLQGRCETQSKCGDVDWFDILMEEVAESIEAAAEPAKLRTELVQVIAVAVAMVEQLDNDEVPQ